MKKAGRILAAISVIFAIQVVPVMAATVTNYFCRSCGGSNLELYSVTVITDDNTNEVIAGPFFNYSNSCGACYN